MSTAPTIAMHSTETGQFELKTGQSQVVVELHDVRKVYQMGTEQVHALAGVSMHFQRGSFWALMGPSGSGKSTLLNLLGCLDRPTGGRYLLEGQDVGALDDGQLSDLRLRHLGFVFQSFHLIPQLTVRENIELPLYYLDWEAKRSAERAEELAAMVGLEQRLNHRPMELSGGQQQRVAIARALANDPAIILADEPTGNLDSATGAQIMGLLSRLNAEGKTIVMVTHEPEIAAHASHRLHLRDGKVDRVEGPRVTMKGEAATMEGDN
jgi:putative ABC transport system ATP-binding protein